MIKILALTVLSTLFHPKECIWESPAHHSIPEKCHHIKYVNTRHASTAVRECKPAIDWEVVTCKKYLPESKWYSVLSTKIVSLSNHPLFDFLEE
ncbi:hypothetical protein UFOVP75_189 [uncultured Caudovirales phage]|uniref:Uncharacterized protein n=1 Tax=uncultured Caudovirales phage TaxID=2100421 RepID=A0A6J5L2J2_9CAUD|nr:hypothetical protein UFOVP75_189 [uncultured Caudovirales phage]